MELLENKRNDGILRPNCIHNSDKCKFCKYSNYKATNIRLDVKTNMRNTLNIKMHAKSRMEDSYENYNPYFEWLY